MGTNLVLIAGCGITLIQNIPAICIGRVLFGWAAGSFSVFVPKYISETAPIHLKGPLGTLTQFFVTFGIVIAFLLALAIPTID
jgi:SP family sugar:H+ symporter-like MFS transporter